MKNNLTQTIQTMKKVDQMVRNPSTQHLTEFQLLAYCIDGIHNQRIRLLIAEYGYPTKRLVGAKTMKDFWLLIQHQDEDISLQELCLNNCDFDPKEKAYLTDRVAIGRQQKQIYGTQFQRKGKIFIPFPVQHPRSVDVLRKKVGLPPLKEALAEHNAMHRGIRKSVRNN